MWFFRLTIAGEGARAAAATRAELKLAKLALPPAKEGGLIPTATIAAVERPTLRFLTMAAPWRDQSNIL